LATVHARDNQRPTNQPTNQRPTTSFSTLNMFNPLKLDLL